MQYSIVKKGWQLKLSEPKGKNNYCYKDTTSGENGLEGESGRAGPKINIKRNLKCKHKESREVKDREKSSVSWLQQNHISYSTVCIFQRGYISELLYCKSVYLATP